jgi:hypothetical protein
MGSRALPGLYRHKNSPDTYRLLPVKQIVLDPSGCLPGLILKGKGSVVCDCTYPLFWGVSGKPYRRPQESVTSFYGYVS